MSLTKDVEIDLDGETFYLRPSLKAANAISREFGGFLGAFEALRLLNLQATQFIVRSACTSKNISTDDLNERVWRAGVGKLTGPLAKFISILQNGGRDPSEEDEKDEREGEQSGNG